MKALKLALLSIAAVLAAPTFAAQPEHLDVPTLNDAFRRLADSEAAAERTTPFGWNDGENRIFRRGEWKFSFNDREITQIRTPKDADVRQFAYFLLKEPWRKRLSPRLREGAELTPGERMAIRVVYLAWIDSLRQLASLGYQHVSFHTCVNSRDFPKSQGKKNVSFGDGSIYGDLKQRFFDRIPGGEKDVAALSGWGASFLEPRNDRRDLLKRIIHRGDEKFVSAMRLKQLNEYFYVEPRVSDFTGELTVIGGMGVDQIASWRDIVGEVLREIGVLASIKDDIGSWRDTFEAKTLSEKDASDLDEEMARLVAELDGANEEAVRRARLVFFDYPLVRACAVFRRDVGKSTSIIYSAETEQENLRNAVRSFLGNIAGTNMLANIKSSYAANEYAAAMGAFKKAAGKKAFGLLQETGIRELGSDTMGRIAEGRDPWSPNEIPDPYANLDQFRREILADAQKAVLVAHSNLTAVAKALAGVGSIRKSLKGAGEKASAALAEAEDTLASALDLPEAKNQAKKAKTWAEQAQDSVSKANLSLDSAESKNGRVKSLNEEIRDKKDEATLNATDAPDIARKAANDAMDMAGEAKNAVPECEAAVKEALRFSESAVQAAEKANKLAAAAAEARKAEEKRIASEKREIVLEAKKNVRLAETAANKSKSAADRIREIARQALADCRPTELSHLDIPEVQAVAAEAKKAAEDALAKAQGAETAANEALGLVSQADLKGNEALQNSALVHSNEIARVVRQALAIAIDSSAEAVDLSERAKERSNDAIKLAKEARDRAQEARNKASLSGADRREEEKRIAAEKRKQAEDATAENDASAAKSTESRKRSADAVAKASAARIGCIPTLKTHLDIPETVERARSADKAGSDSIAAAKSADRTAAEAEERIRKSRAQIEIVLSQVAVALDDSRSPDDVRDALDRAIKAAAEATGFAREGKEAATKAEELSLSAEADAGEAEEWAGRTTDERKAAEKSRAEELKRLAEESIALVDRAGEEAAGARIELEDARTKARDAQELCVPTKDSNLDIPEIKKLAAEAVKVGDAALKDARTAEVNANDSASEASAARKNADASIAQCLIALDEGRKPDEVRAAIDRAIDLSAKASLFSESAKSFSAKANESSKSAMAKASDAHRGATDAMKKRIAEETSTANAMKTEAESAIRKAEEAGSTADEAVDRSARASQEAESARPDIEARLKDKTLSDEDRKAAKDARRAADAAKSAAKDALSYADDAKNYAKKARAFAETALDHAAAAIVPDADPKAVREALDKAIRAARDAADKAEGARKEAEKASAAADKAEENAQLAN